MTLTDELKISDDKIKANQAKYDLSWETAEISALFSKNLLEKNEYELKSMNWWRFRIQTKHTWKS